MKAKIFLLFNILFRQRFYIFLYLLCMSFTNSFGQTSVGKGFWFGFPAVKENYTAPADTVLKYLVKITSLVNTSGTITIPGSGFSQSFTVTPGMVTSVLLPNTAVIDTFPEALKSNAVHITSLDNITVSAFAFHSQRNYSMLIIPTTSLGSLIYYVLSYQRLCSRPIIVLQLIYQNYIDHRR